MRLSKDTISVKCILSDAEKLDYSTILSKNIAEKTSKESELKAMASQFKAEIAKHDAEIEKYSGLIRSGYEYRMKDCNIEYDWKNKVKRYIDRQTLVVHREDIISEHELQEQLRLEKEEKKEAEAKVTDETLE